MHKFAILKCLKIFQSKSNIEEEEEEEIQNMTGNRRCWHFFFFLVGSEHWLMFNSEEWTLKVIRKEVRNKNWSWLTQYISLKVYRQTSKNVKISIQIGSWKNPRRRISFCFFQLFLLISLFMMRSKLILFFFY